MLQFCNFNGSLFHRFGDAVLNGLSPKDLYLVLGTNNSFFESDHKEQESIYCFRRLVSPVFKQGRGCKNKVLKLVGGGQWSGNACKL